MEHVHHDPQYIPGIGWDCDAVLASIASISSDRVNRCRERNTTRASKRTKRQMVRCGVGMEWHSASRSNFDQLATSGSRLSFWWWLYRMSKGSYIARFFSAIDYHLRRDSCQCVAGILFIFTVSDFGDSVLPALSVAENWTVVVPSVVITNDALSPWTMPCVV